VNKVDCRIIGEYRQLTNAASVEPGGSTLVIAHSCGIQHAGWCDAQIRHPASDAPQQSVLADRLGEGVTAAGSGAALTNHL